MAWGWYFYITWLPTYLQQARGQSMGDAALLAGMPLFFGGIGSLVAGFALRSIERRLGPASARRALAQAGMAASGALLALSVHIESPVLAMTVMGLASLATIWRCRRAGAPAWTWAGATPEACRAR